MRYGVGLGRQGYSWKGRAIIQWKRKWPTWTPPAAMIGYVCAPSRPTVAPSTNGSVTGTATGSCVRCLTELVEEVDEDFQVLYVWPGGRGRPEAEEVDPETQEDVRELDGDLLDLEPAVRDAVVPGFPFQPVCTPDCPGLCDRCGARLADDPDHEHDEIDPRWAALQQLSERDEK